jgi:adenosine kinase
MFSGEDLLAILAKASYVAVNDYEGKMLEEKTGRSLRELANGVKALVITRGAEGSVIHADGRSYDIPCVKADEVVDPTGCGDAYRAGLLYGIVNKWDWVKAGRLAAVMGALKIASRGGQNHTASRPEIAQRFRAAFGQPLD